MAPPLAARDQLAVEWRGTLPDDWDELAWAEQDPFMSRAWLDSWWGVNGAGDADVCCVRRGGGLVAAVPLRRAGRRLRGWASAPNDPATRPLAPDAPEAAAILAEAVAGRRFASIDLGRSIPVGDPACIALRQALDRRCLVSVDRFDEEPIVDTTGEFDDYLRGISRSVRTRLGKHRRRLERDHRPRVEVLVEPDDVRGEVQAALELEAAGWKGAAGSATLCFPRETELIHAMSRAFAARGELVLSRLWVNESLAAVDLAVLYGNRVWSLITSYEEGLGRYSPGLLLRIALIESCFERGIAANELLGTVLPWKRWFMTSSRPVCAVEAYPRWNPASYGRFAWRRWALRAVKRTAQVPGLRRPWKAVKGVRAARVRH